MGFSIAWIAIHGKTQRDILQALDMRRAKKIGAVPDAPFCYAKLPKGWHLVHFQDWQHKSYLPRPHMEVLSRGCRLVGCQVEEHFMISCAFAYANGQRLWNLLHYLDRGPMHLETDGVPPAGFAELLARAQERKVCEGVDDSPDYVFDVPVDIAEQLTGYRHDRPVYDWGGPEFYRLNEVKSV